MVVVLGGAPEDRRELSTGPTGATGAGFGEDSAEHPGDRTGATSSE